MRGGARAGLKRIGIGQGRYMSGGIVIENANGEEAPDVSAAAENTTIKTSGIFPNRQTIIPPLDTICDPGSQLTLVVLSYPVDKQMICLFSLCLSCRPFLI